MIKHIWTVICSQVVLDKYTNNLSFHNVIERITINEKPVEKLVIPIELMVASFWVRPNQGNPEQCRIRVNFISPSQKKLAENNMELNLDEHLRVRSILRLQGLPAPEEGDYNFQVEIYTEAGKGWETVAVVPLEIIYRPLEIQN